MINGVEVLKPGELMSGKGWPNESPFQNKYWVWWTHKGLLSSAFKAWYSHFGKATKS